MRTKKKHRESVAASRNERQSDPGNPSRADTRCAYTYRRAWSTMLCSAARTECGYKSIGKLTRGSYRVWRAWSRRKSVEACALGFSSEGGYGKRGQTGLSLETIVIIARARGEQQGERCAPSSRESKEPSAAERRSTERERERGDRRASSRVRGLN